MSLTDCSITRARSSSAATTPMEAVSANWKPSGARRAKTCSASTDPRPEEPATLQLQLRQAIGLPDDRAADRRAYQRRADPRPLGANPAGRRLDPSRHGNGLPDHAPA